MSHSAQSPTYLADSIHETVLIQEHERVIIDSPIFQRLRRIKQLGNVFLLFPGALHTRFEHSIGVMHIAGLYFDALFRKMKNLPNEKMLALEQLKQLVRLAALLHDVGHGPFSHLFEKFLKGKKARDLLEGENTEKDDVLYIPKAWFANNITETDKSIWFDKQLEHEHYSYAIVNYIVRSIHSASTEQTNAIFYPGIDQDICSLIDDKIPPTSQFVSLLNTVVAQSRNGSPADHLAGADASSLKRCLHSIISSDLDADKLDYLQRDAYYCGMRTNNIDIKYMFNSLFLDKDKHGVCYICIPPKIIPSFEQVLIVRRQMYAKVYLHRVNSTFDELLASALDGAFRNKKNELFVRSAIKFLSLTDDWLENCVFSFAKTVAAKAQQAIEELEEDELASLMYFTRTMPVKLLEKIVPQIEKPEQEELIRHYCLSKKQSSPFMVSPKIKELTTTLRDGVKSDDPEDGIFRVESSLEGIESINIGYRSEVLHSSLWRDTTIRLIAFRSLKESAKDPKRNLPNRIRLRFG